MTDCSNIRTLKNRNNLRSSSPHPGPRPTSGEPRRNFAVRNSSTRKPWLFRSPVFDSGIRRFDGEAVGGRRLARTPPQRRRALAGGFDAPPAAALSSAGDDSRPHHAILDRKIAARLFRRFPRPVGSENNTRFLFFLNGFCLYGDRIPPTPDRDRDHKLARLKGQGFVCQQTCL